MFSFGFIFAQKPFSIALAECPRNFSQSFTWPGYDCLGGFLFSSGRVIKLLLITSLFSLLISWENVVANESAIAWGWAGGAKEVGERGQMWMFSS